MTDAHREETSSPLKGEDVPGKSMRESGTCGGGRLLGIMPQRSTFSQQHGHHSGNTMAFVRSKPKVPKILDVTKNKHYELLTRVHPRIELGTCTT